MMMMYLQVMLRGAGSPGGDELLTVTVVRDENGFGMKVSGTLLRYFLGTRSGQFSVHTGLYKCFLL